MLREPVRTDDAIPSRLGGDELACLVARPAQAAERRADAAARGEVVDQRWVPACVRVGAGPPGVQPDEDATTLESRVPGAYRACVDDGVEAALAASNLARVPGAALERLLMGARLVRVSAGSVTHREGETAELLELVVDGLVRVFVTAPDGRSLTVRYARRGSLLGVVSMYATGFRMPAGTQAVIDAEVLRMSPDVVRLAAATDPHVADALLRELADRVVSFVHEIPDGAFSSVRQRVARHLLDLAAQESRATRGTRPRLTVSVSQRDLAQAVGSVREVVVRVLRDFRESGVITTHPDHIDLLDPARLSLEQGGTWVPPERPH